MHNNTTVIMIKKLILFVFPAIVMASCTTVRKSSVTLPLKEDLPSTTQFSNEFRMFWFDYATEVNKKKKIDNYRPSAGMIAHYGLGKDGNTYFLSGNLTILPDIFNMDDAAQAGVRLKKMTYDIYTFSCDVKRLPLLIEIQGIKYIELGHRVYQRLY